MADGDALDTLLAQLGMALQPLVNAASSPEAMQEFLLRLGWELNPPPTAVMALRAPAEQVYTLAVGEGTSDADVGALLNGARTIFTAISDLSGSGLPAPFAADFPRQLVDYLVCDYLLRHQGRWGYALLAMGVLRLEKRPPAGGRPAYVRRIVAYEDFPDLLNDPLTFFKNSYAWDSDEFRGQDFQRAVAGLLDAWGQTVRSSPVDQQSLAKLNAGATGPAANSATRLVLFRSQSHSPLEAGVGLFLVPKTASQKPGFAVLPYGTARFDQDLPLGENVTLSVDGTVALDGGVGAIVRPDGIEVKIGLDEASAGSAEGTLSIALVIGQEGEPTLILGSADSSRFEIKGASVLGGTRFRSGGDFEVFTELGVEGAKVVIQPGEDADGFLSTLLPGGGLSISTDLTVGFSTTQGLYFGGSSGLEIALPAHIQLGPIEIMSALLAVRFADPGGVPEITIEMAATIRGDLSVIKAVVENVGVQAVFRFPPDRKGNLGPADLEMRFRPPNGVGISIDAGLVQGGGYLFLDPDRGEYAGALELTVSNFLSLKAIGLINTQMPGRDGFSLLVIITADFDPGFQLGYGFTLLGVGGLIGLNRGMLLEPLAQGIRTGAINGILFPTNVIENAPRIISDLRAIFPPRESTFLIGPMAKIGWGTPTLISVSLGVIIEIPGNVAILGRIRIALPTDEAAVIVMQVSFLGALEFDRKRIWFFASLYESRVLFITLDGEMGLLMDYSDNPNFVLSVGGFHPQFTPPPLPFPSPNRVALSLINESWARVRVDVYLAVTTNTVQAGAHAEAFFGFSALSVEGHFGFDALIRFSPFYLVVEVSAGFCVKVFGLGVWGIHLRASLEGPTPWHVRGHASISLLFLTIDVPVEVTFGERRAETLKPIDVLAELATEFGKLENWRAGLPSSGRLLVSLRELGEGDALVLHPVGILEVSQRRVPLNVPLAKLGNQKARDVKNARIEVTGGALQVKAATKERFAKAQFQDMDDAAKLSLPGYEQLDGGIALGSAGESWGTGPTARRTVRYEQIIVDTAHERVRKAFFAFWPQLFQHFAKGAAIRKSDLSLAREKQRKPFAAKVEVLADRFAVALQTDNRLAGADTVFSSHTEAMAHVASVIAADPSQADRLHVIPSAEVNQAA